MKKKTILISLATFGLLLSGLVGCGNKPSEQPVSKPEESSQKSEDPKPSSEEQKPSSETPQPSSEAPVHEHVYAQVGEAEKNADDKEVKLYECEAKDSRYIGIAFVDYSAIDAAFDSAANASKYAEVDASIWDDAHMLAKTKGTGISWKINVDKAIEGAKLSLGLTSTYDSHSSTDMAGQFKVKVNDGETVNASITGTYADNGLAPSKRTYVEFATINLVAGENTIRLTQESTSNRLLFGGDVRIIYTGDAKPVTPFPGYNVTFTVEHCKVLVFNTKAYETETPVETLSCKAKDEEGNIVAYDPEDIELQPQVSFKVVCDEGYSVTVNNVTITPRENYKNLKQNPDSQEGQDDIFRATKIQGDITIAIVAQAGEQAKGYKVQFVTSHCSVKVYIGPKNADGTNLDTIEDGVFYARIKDAPYDIGYTTPQINFSVVCDEGYEFVPVIDENSKVEFIQGDYNKFQIKTHEAGDYYNMTKIASDLVITITATPKA
jgi:hypothetical protein